MDLRVRGILKDARAWAAAVFLAVAGAASPCMARAAEPDCYDALVVAQIARQIPTAIPNCDGCIIMRWPWLIDLDVLHVSRGRAPQGRLTVLTIQHTYYRTDAGPVRWWLRRNRDGGYNVLHVDENARLPRCAKNVGLAKPYVRLAPGESLSDLARAGLDMYGPGPQP